MFLPEKAMLQSRLRSFGGLHLSQSANWPPYPNPWNKNRVLDMWSHREIHIQRIFIKYLGTRLTPWSVWVAMRKPRPRSAARGVKRMRNEDPSRAAPTIRFVPTLPARYPLGASVRITPQLIELKMMPWIWGLQSYTGALKKQRLLWQAIYRKAVA